VAFFGVVVFSHPVPLLFDWLAYPLPVLCCCGFGGVVVLWFGSCYWFGLAIGLGGCSCSAYGGRGKGR